MARRDRAHQRAASVVAIVYCCSLVALYLWLEDFFIYAAVVLVLSLIVGAAVGEPWAIALPWAPAVVGVAYAALGPEPVEDPRGFMALLLVVLAATASALIDVGVRLRRRGSALAEATDSS